MNTKPCSAETKLRKFYVTCPHCGRVKILNCSFNEIYDKKCENCAQSNNYYVVNIKMKFYLQTFNRIGICFNYSFSLDFRSMNSLVCTWMSQYNHPHNWSIQRNSFTSGIASNFIFIMFFVTFFVQTLGNKKN